MLTRKDIQIVTIGNELIVFLVQPLVDIGDEEFKEKLLKYTELMPEDKSQLPSNFYEIQTLLTMQVLKNYAHQLENGKDIDSFYLDFVLFPRYWNIICRLDGESMSQEETSHALKHLLPTNNRLHNVFKDNRDEVVVRARFVARYLLEHLHCVSGKNKIHTILREAMSIKKLNLHSAELGYVNSQLTETSDYQALIDYLAGDDALIAIIRECMIAQEPPLEAPILHTTCAQKFFEAFFQGNIRLDAQRLANLTLHLIRKLEQHPQEYCTGKHFGLANIANHIQVVVADRKTDGYTAKDASVTDALARVVRGKSGKYLPDYFFSTDGTQAQTQAVIAQRLYAMCYFNLIDCLTAAQGKLAGTQAARQEVNQAVLEQLQLFCNEKGFEISALRFESKIYRNNMGNLREFLCLLQASIGEPLTDDPSLYASHAERAPRLSLKGLRESLPALGTRAGGQ